MVFGVRGLILFIGTVWTPPHLGSSRHYLYTALSDLNKRDDRFQLR
jgi:hypothetical protein